MKSYSEREMFTPTQIRLFNQATHLINAINLSDDDLPSDEIRCHELARAVTVRLALEPSTGLQLEWVDKLVVVDGAYGSVDHSWIEFEEHSTHGKVETEGRVRKTLLDVYAVGRLPMVQLLDVQSFGPKNVLQYRKGDTRGDIRQRVVHQILKHWLKVLPHGILDQVAEQCTRSPLEEISSSS